MKTPSLGAAFTMIFAGLLVGLTLPPPLCCAESQVGVWVSPGGPSGIWEKSFGDPFPVKMIVGDLAELGITDVFFFEQAGRGGPFLHPTEVQHAETQPRMRGRDWLGELLAAAEGKRLRVWLAWTPPGDKYPDTDFRGLNHPAIQKIYLDEIEEVAARYGRFRSLAGIMWHEVDCSEAPDLHEDDREEFSEYCRTAFGQPYTDAAMPPAMDPLNPWWRRFALYKVHVVNRLVSRTAEAARCHGLQMLFCSYTPETFSGQSWRWGYDVVALEELCDQQWFSAYSVESGKAYQEIRGAWLDFGASYQGQILPRNYAYMFHGRRPSYFEYRTPVYLEAMRRYYSSHKSFHEKYPDVYNDYFGHSDEELALFYGKENIAAWLRAATAWQGGQSTASVAVAVHPIPFVLAHPASSGNEYEKKVRGLMVALSRTTDVDALVFESRQALDVRNLLRYRLIVIPEDMGRLLSARMTEILGDYVAQGGRLLVIATGLSQGRADLVDEVDLTRRFCGVEITGPGLPGYVETDKTTIDGRPARFWAGQRVPLRVEGAEVLVRERSSGGPLLVRSGNVAFSALGFSPEAAGYFQDTVRDLLETPTGLDATGDLRILEGVAKDQRICLACWGRGQGKLRVDVRTLGLQSPACKVLDIVTGASFGEPSAEQMAAGIPIEIKYPHQPLILMISAADDRTPAKGLYASDEVFRNLPQKKSTENPEVPHESGGTTPAAAPADGAEAVRDRELGTLDFAPRDQTAASKRAAERSREECRQVLEEAGLSPKWVNVNLFLPEGRLERNRYKRIFVPGATGYLSQAVLEGMDDYVRSGGLLVTAASLILLDANADGKADPGEGITRFASEGFLGVFGHASCRMERLMVTRGCPLTAGLPEGWFALETPTAGRRTTVLSAETVTVAAGAYGDRKIEQQPFLTFKHSGKGAAIYLVGQVGAKSDPRLKQILRNALAPETLRWLCWQPPDK